MRGLHLFWMPFIFGNVIGNEVQGEGKPGARILNNHPQVNWTVGLESRGVRNISSKADTVISQFSVTDSRRQLPTSIEIKSGSTLSAEYGQPVEIYFEVTNHMPYGHMYSFRVYDSYSYVREIQPSGGFIEPGNTQLVRVLVQAREANGNAQRDIVVFTAVWANGDSVIKKVYFYTTKIDYDSSGPDIWYEYTGDCYDALTPTTCNKRSWGAEVHIQDKKSGVLTITTNPSGLILSQEFIAGTRDQVNGRYSSSCCNTKFLVEAIDVFGNKYSRVIDIERKWLSTGEIAAIVVGSICIVLILILIIVAIVSCVRKRKTTLNIYPHS